VTLPLIHLLRQSTDGLGSRIIRDIIASRAVTPDQWSELLRCLKEHASIGLRVSPRRRVRRARQEAAVRVPPSSEREALLALPDYVLSRDR